MVKTVETLSIAAMRKHLDEGTPLHEEERAAWSKIFEMLEGAASKDSRLAAFADAVALDDGARGRPKSVRTDVHEYSSVQAKKLIAVREVCRLRKAEKVPLRRAFARVAERLNNAPTIENLGRGITASNIERWYYELPLREVAEWIDDPSGVDGESKEWRY